MNNLYCKVYSVVRRENYIMLYLDRPAGYTITPIAWYELSFEQNKVVAPIANGNTIKALKFIIPKTRDNYWVNKLTERDIVRVNPTPVIAYKDFKPTCEDTFLCYGDGVAAFTSYFTQPEYVIPARFIYEVKNINDCFELALIGNIMKQNLRIHIDSKTSKAQRNVINSDEKLKNLIKFVSGINSIPSTGRVFVSNAPEAVINKLQADNISYTSIPEIS